MSNKYSRFSVPHQTRVQVPGFSLTVRRQLQSLGAESPTTNGANGKAVLNLL